MIQKFRWKFIGASVAALLIVLLITLGSLVGITRIQNQNEVNRVLTALVKNEVIFHRIMRSRLLAIRMT